MEHVWQLQNANIFQIFRLLFSIFNADIYFMTDRNEATSTNPMTNVVYEDIREDTNDQRNKGKNYNILLHLM